MCPATHNSSSRSGRRSRRGAALYVTVLSTTLIVSLLGLAGMAVVRIERLNATAMEDVLRARQNARSAVELALRVVANTSTWRTTYPNGVESSRLSLGSNGKGTVSWYITDTDGSLSNPDASLKLFGVGRVGSAVQVSSIQVEAAKVGPNTLRSYYSLSSLASERLEDDEWFCQYIKPTNLPANAIAWRVTSVRIIAQRTGTSRAFNVRVYQPNGLGMPSGAALDSVAANSNSFPSSVNWFSPWTSIAFTGTYWLAPDSGVCVALETTSTLPPIDFYYRSSGESEANSALVFGTPTWTTIAHDQALLYEVNGVYVLSSGEVAPIAGTWQRQASPDPPISTAIVN